MRCSRRTFVFAAAGLAVTASAGPARPVVGQEASVGDLVVYADTVLGGQNVPKNQAAERSCVLSSRYPRNSEIVWRVRVIDRETGESMDDTMLESLKVTLSDGQVFDMHYGPHPGPPNPPRDYYWTVSWLIPMDYPTGTFSYTVTATSTDGRTGEFKPFDLPPSLPTVTDEVFSETGAEGGAAATPEATPGT